MLLKQNCDVDCGLSAYVYGHDSCCSKTASSFELDQACHMCGYVQESLLHCLWACKATHEVWLWIMRILGVAKKHQHNMCDKPNFRKAVMLQTLHFGTCY